jgi:predicted acetyltransferase
MLGAFDGRQLVGSARYHPMRQWWQGKSLPMAGVAGVKVAPEYRGRGAGRALMTELIAEMARQGYPVSALYPATAPLYRSLGWEIAGGRYETTLPMSSLHQLVAVDQALTGGAAAGLAGERQHDAAALRRAGPADAAVVAETLGRVYGALRDCGPATHDPGFIADWLDSDDHFAYLADDGFLSYHWADGHDSIRVELLAAASAPTARAFWQLLGSHATMADEVRACLAPDDPVRWLTREPAAAVRLDWSWMLRLIDVRSAIEARGFPAAVEMSVQLELADDVLPGNAGRWRLDISDGVGKIARAGPAGQDQGLHLGARGLAALYAGVPLSTLRRAGLALGGDQATDTALDSAFGGRQAFMLHAF